MAMLAETCCAKHQVTQIWLCDWWFVYNFSILVS